MPRTDTSVKAILTDASFVAQDGEVTLDTTGTETVTRNKTVRSRLHALRRLVAGSTRATLHVTTLEGKMLNAIGALSSSPSAADIINAVNDAVTGAGTEGEVTSVLSSRSFLKLLCDLTVVRNAGAAFSLDDMGESSSLLRVPQASTVKFSVRRLINDANPAGSQGVFYLRTLGGDAIATIAALTAGSATGDNIRDAVLNIHAETSVTADFSTATGAAPAARVPSRSVLEMLQSVLRKRSGLDRDVVVDNVGFNTTTTRATGGRYSVEKSLFDLASAAGARVFTTAGEALEAVASLNPSTANISAIVTAVQNAL